jgi:2-amino-4-hydroxy-6-hydroxymethyldihydropteridine diphosphokinase
MSNLTKMSKAYLLLGSNIGNREYYFFEAEKLISESIGKIVKSSRLYETEPWGIKSKDLFLNKAIIVETNQGPGNILEKILDIELCLGRKRTEIKYSSRTIDIDILFIDQLILNSETLIVPHPQIASRRFVLIPMAEICPEFIHPVFSMNIKQLLVECKDKLKVKKLE